MATKQSRSTLASYPGFPRRKFIAQPWRNIEGGRVIGNASRFAEEIRLLNADIARQAKERQTLRDLDCFVLDNSLRESTVGQLRGHTLENKLKIFEEVKKCGFKHIVVAAFSHMTRVDDVFMQQLVDQGEDLTTLYSFADVTEGVKDGVLDTTTIPIALQKMKKLKLRNPIIEIDLANKSVDWDNKFTVQDMCELLLQRIDWSFDNLSNEALIFVNFRDFPFAMSDAPERVLTVVHYLASLPIGKRPVGITYEEPTGKYLPEEVRAWTASVRRVMDACGWQSGNLLVHVHKQWGLAETVQLECLSSGANGIWASVCEEGAAMGHACSSIALMNLVRLGNEKVLKRYNCTYLRTAAANVTHITTGSGPHPKQVVYGDQSLDMAFDFGGIAGGHVNEGEFDMAKFFGVEPPVRINTLASADMVQKRLVDLFGEDSQFTKNISLRMKEVMIEDLITNRKEEYMSKVGLALLFARAGGKITANMRDEIEKMEVGKPHLKELIDQGPQPKRVCHGGAQLQKESTSKANDLSYLQVGHLVAVQTETLSDAPRLGRVTRITTSDIELVWLEGGYTRPWKIVKLRRGKNLVEWKDKVKPNTVMMYGIDLTATSRLKRSTAVELRKLYTAYCTS